MFNDIRRRLLVAGGSLAAMFLIGTAGYVLIEGWSWFDSLYMTTITLATIGFGEVHPLSTSGRAFTIFLAAGGLSVAAYSFSSLTALIVEGELTDVLRRRKMSSKISALKDHYIVCGGGNTGRTIIEELRRTDRPFVVIEKNDEKARKMQEAGTLVVHADALTDESLEAAGITGAAGVFCVLENDRDNVFVAISARGLNARARIVSEIHDEHVRPKLLRGGADAVVSSNIIGGLRLASEMIRPATVGFLDSMIRDAASNYRFEEIAVPPGSPLIGKSAADAEKGAASARVLAIRQGDSPRYDINPPASRRLASGETLVVIGNAEQVGDLKKRLAGA